MCQHMQVTAASRSSSCVISPRYDLAGDPGCCCEAYVASACWAWRGVHHCRADSAVLSASDSILCIKNGCCTQIDRADPVGCSPDDRLQKVLHHVRGRAGTRLNCAGCVGMRFCANSARGQRYPLQAVLFGAVSKASVAARTLPMM